MLPGKITCRVVAGQSQRRIAEILGRWPKCLPCETRKPKRIITAGAVFPLMVPIHLPVVK